MESTIKYIFEAGMLKRVARSGWWTESINHPESVADHTFRTAIIAFILAKMEGFDDERANKICTAAVFHDIHEARLSDLHKIASFYVKDKEKIEKEIEKDQIRKIEPKLAQAIVRVFGLKGKELDVLKDADYLECAFQAKEYSDIGYDTSKWIDNAQKKLTTKSAKELIKKLKSMKSGQWRDELRKSV